MKKAILEKMKGNGIHWLCKTNLGMSRLPQWP
jgi:hypothetical protein